MLEPVLYICLAQSIFAGIVIASKRPQFLADRFLASWLFIIGVETLLALVKLNYLEQVPYQLPFLVVPFIYGPLLFFYVRSLIFEKPTFHLSELIHFLPFILLLGIAFLFRDQPDDLSNQVTPIITTKLARIIFSMLLFISLTTYSIIVYILLTRHRIKIQEQFSFKSGHITLNWLLFVSITIYVSYILTFLSSGIQLFDIRLPFDPKIFSYTGLTLFSFAFSFYGYRQAAIYHNTSDILPSLTNGERVPLRKYSKSNLTRQDLQQLLKLMDRLMKDKKLYMQPELSLDQVSEASKVPKHHLTQALNTELEKSFYQYINEMRVSAFIERIQQPSSRSFTLLAIAFECGFNSKSTFNAVFKKITGTTPSEYYRSTVTEAE